MKKISALSMCILLVTMLLGGCGEAQDLELTVDGDSQISKADEAISVYEDMLKAAPAIEGAPEELMDASFDYDMNHEKFGDHYDMYAIVDINEDEIPELIALSRVNMCWAPISVFTYSDGQAVLLEDPVEPTPHGTFEQNSSASGAYYTYICEERHIHSVWKGDTPIGEVEENNAYLLDGTSLSLVDCAVGESDNTIYFYDIAKAN